MIYIKYIKSLLDVTIAVILLICCSPVFLLVIFVLLATQGRSIIYSQVRSGQHLKNFNLFKFRTLKGNPKNSLGMHGRGYTKTGKFMRKTGIDELPQLINIVKGEMSFIGPRPLPVEYENRYSVTERRRFELKPGLTGWAQVNGRNETSWGRRFELDNWYIDHASFLVDINVMLRTVALILKTMFRKGKDEVKMDEFKGTRLI